MNCMENSSAKLIQKIPASSFANKLPLIILVVAILAGLGTGKALSSSQKSQGLAGVGIPGASPTVASQDNQTFKDFAEGTIEPKPSTTDNSYSEGAYLLKRPNAQDVALTSSVVDLSKYIGKKVKVYGETQKALEAGWLMDVGKVETE